MEKTRKKEGTFKMSSKPKWLSVVDERSSVDSNIITQYIRNDLTKFEAQLKNLKIKVHSVVCSVVGELVNTTAGTIKLTLLPLPAKTTVFRSVSISSSHSTSDIEISSVTYDFALKSVSMPMGIGDIRSRIFREGICPILLVEFSSAGYSASSSIYLPHLISDYSGQSLHLNLACTSPQTKIFDRATVILEISSAISSPIFNNVLNESDSSTSFNLSIIGLAGAELQNIVNWKSDLRLSCCLASTGVRNEIDLSNGTTYKGIALDISKDILLQSSRMRSDVIEINLRNSATPSVDHMDDMGAVYIPCAALVTMLDSHNNDVVDGTTNSAIFVFNAWKWQGRSASGSSPISVQNWQFICKFTEESPATLIANTGVGDPMAPETADTNVTSTAEREKGVSAENKLKHSRNYGMTSHNPGQGSFLLCVQGFFCNRGTLSGTIMSQSNTIAVEISLFPDGVKSRSTLSSFLPIPSGDFEASIEWNKCLSSFIGWTADQVPFFFN